MTSSKNNGFAHATIAAAAAGVMVAIDDITTSACSGPASASIGSTFSVGTVPTAIPPSDASMLLLVVVVSDVTISVFTPFGVFVMVTFTIVLLDGTVVCEVAAARLPCWWFATCSAVAVALFADAPTALLSAAAHTTSTDAGGPSPAGTAAADAAADESLPVGCTTTPSACAAFMANSGWALADTSEMLWSGGPGAADSVAVAVGAATVDDGPPATVGDVCELAAECTPESMEPADRAEELDSDEVDDEEDDDEPVEQTLPPATGTVMVTAAVVVDDVLLLLLLLSVVLHIDAELQGKECADAVLMWMLSAVFEMLPLPLLRLAMVAVLLLAAGWAHEAETTL